MKKFARMKLKKSQETAQQVLDRMLDRKRCVLCGQEISRGIMSHCVNCSRKLIEMEMNKQTYTPVTPVKSKPEDQTYTPVTPVKSKPEDQRGINRRE
jgi:ribosomal protein L37AE/L43A